MPNKEYNITHTQMGGGELKEDVGGGSAALTPATANTLGGVKIGNGISVTEDGIISAQGGKSEVRVLMEVQGFDPVNIGKIDFDNPPILYTMFGLYSAPIVVSTDIEGEHIEQILYGGSGVTEMDLGTYKVIMNVYQDEDNPNMLMDPDADVYVHITMQQVTQYATQEFALDAGGDYVAVIGRQSSAFYDALHHTTNNTSKVQTINSGGSYISLKNNDDIVVCYPRYRGAGIDYEHPAKMKDVYKDVHAVIYYPFYYDGSDKMMSGEERLVNFGPVKEHDSGSIGYGALDSYTYLSYANGFERFYYMRFSYAPNIDGIEFSMETKSLRSE